MQLLFSLTTTGLLGDIFGFAALPAMYVSVSPKVNWFPAEKEKEMDV